VVVGSRTGVVVGSKTGVAVGGNKKAASGSNTKVNLVNVLKASLTKRFPRMTEKYIEGINLDTATPTKTNPMTINPCCGPFCILYVNSDQSWDFLGISSFGDRNHQRLHS
jgi:hypothetical protein